MNISPPEPTRTRAFGRRPIFWLVLAVALSQVLAFGGVYSWSWAPAQICLTLGLLYLLLGSFRRHTRLPGHPILIPTALFGMLVAVQWAGGLSVYPALTLSGLIQLSSGGLMLYLSYYCFRSSRTNLRYLSVALWLFTGLLAGEAIVQYFEAGQMIYWVKAAAYSTPVGPFVYHNHYAGLMDLLLPVSFAAAFWPLSGARPGWLVLTQRGLCPALGLASLVASQSRGGFFTILLEGVLALVVFWAPIRGARRGGKRTIVVILAFVAFASLANWQPLMTRLNRLDYHDLSADYRIAVAKTCVLIWHDHPWLGTGFDTFPDVYPAYETFDIGLRWDHAHNEYAQALAETGVAGSLLILVFLLFLLRACGWRTPARPAPEQIYLRACAIGIVGFLFHSAGDFLFHAPADMLMFFLLSGAVVAGAARAHRRRHAPHSQAQVVELAPARSGA